MALLAMESEGETQPSNSSPRVVTLTLSPNLQRQSAKAAIVSKSKGKITMEREMGAPFDDRKESSKARRTASSAQREALHPSHSSRSRLLGQR